MLTTQEDTVDVRLLLKCLRAFRKGDFSARMPDDRTGLAGEIAAAFNESIEFAAGLTGELERIGNVVVVFFYQKSTTRNYYLLDFSTSALRGAEIWHIWKQHFLIEWFWKMLKSVFKINAMRLRGVGLYTGLLIKILAYLLAMRLQTHREFSHLSMTQLMRKIQRDYRLQELMNEHFHLPDFFKQGMMEQTC